MGARNINDFIINRNVLVAYKGDEDHVIIPDEVDTIGDSAFYGNHRIRTIDLIDVIRIRDNAFADCSSLETVIIHEDLREIGYYAFEDCSSLKEISARGPVADTYTSEPRTKGC